MSTLQHLQVDNLNLETLLTKINVMKDLKILKLSNINSRTCDDIPGIENMPNLKYLNLSNSHFSKLLIKKVIKLPLEGLYLSNCNLAKPLIILALNAPHLKKLDLSGNINFDDTIIVSITQQASRLQSLNIKDCSFLTDAGVMKIVERLKNLTKLKFNFNDKNIARQVEEILHERLDKLPEASPNKRPKLLPT